MTFSIPQNYLDIKKKNQFQTVTGGFLSLGIWIMIIVSYSSMILQTLNLTNITSQQTVIKQNNPPKLSIKMQKGANFMFGIRMLDLNQYIFNLNDKKRYFDIYAKKVYSKSSLVFKLQNIQLEKCTKDHWSDFPNILSDYDTLKIDYWLCPPKDTVFDLQGMHTSQFSSTVAFRIASCNNFTNVNNICASPQQIKELMANRTNFSVNLYFTNPVINPNMKDYIDYYLQNQGTAIFSKDLGSQTLVYLADYIITSDNSYWPFQSIQKQSGSILDGNVINRPMTIDPDKPVYANIVMFKSSASFMIKREVQKISSVFSYIGGFFGALTAALFIIKAYTDSAFQYSLATNLFETDNQENKKQQKESFHLFKFIGMKIYTLFQNFGLKKKWDKMQKILQEQQEVKNHLNIVSLLRRIIAMEDYLTYVFQDYQIEGIKMQKNKTLNHIKELRKKFSQFQDETQDIIYPQIDTKITDSNISKQSPQIKEPNILNSQQQSSAIPIVSTYFEKNRENNQDSAIKNEKEDIQSINVLNLGNNNIPFSMDCEVIENNQPQIIDLSNEILKKLKESSAFNRISQKILSRIPQMHKKKA